MIVLLAFLEVTHNNALKKSYILGDFTKINEIIKKNKSELVKEILASKKIISNLELRGAVTRLIETPRFEDLFVFGTEYGIEDFICTLLNKFLESIGTKFRLKIITKGDRKYIAVYSTEDLKNEEVINELFSYGVSMEKILSMIRLEEDQKKKFYCSVSGSIIPEHDEIEDDERGYIVYGDEFQLRIELFNKGTLPVKLYFIQNCLPPFALTVKNAPKDLKIDNYDIYFAEQPVLNPAEKKIIHLEVKAKHPFSTEYLPAIFFICNEDITYNYFKPVNLCVSE